GRAQLVPLVITTAGRHEGQLPRKASEPRSRHPFDAGLPIASSAMLINHEQMDRPAEIGFKPRAAHGLKAFGRHTAIRDGSASYRICRKNLYGGIGVDPLNTITWLRRRYSRMRTLNDSVIISLWCRVNTNRFPRQSPRGTRFVRNFPAGPDTNHEFPHGIRCNNECT